ncbi:hypothetical protein EMIT0P100_30031 [Pseudomonas sp. IT-P100]
MDFVADALIAALEKILLHRLAHLQQHAFQIHLMTAFHCRHGQLHHHHRRATLIILHCALAGDLRLGIILRDRFNFPAIWPRHDRRLCMSASHARQQANQNEQRFTESDHCNEYSRIEPQSLSLARLSGNSRRFGFGDACALAYHYRHR